MEPIIAIILGAGIVVGISGLVYEATQTPWGSRSPLRDMPDEIVVMGRTIAIEHLHGESGRPLRKGPPRTGYRIALPSAMQGLGLIDSEASQRWWETTEYNLPKVRGAPSTGEAVFDGTFMFTDELSDASALEHPGVRATLLEARQACDGIWIRDGELCILELAPFSESAAEVSGEFLVGVVERLESALT